jgi:hypothetical protein
MTVHDSVTGASPTELSRDRPRADEFVAAKFIPISLRARELGRATKSSQSIRSVPRVIARKFISPDHGTHSKRAFVVRSWEHQPTIARSLIPMP